MFLRKKPPRCEVCERQRFEDLQPGNAEIYDEFLLLKNFGLQNAELTPERLDDFIAIIAAEERARRDVAALQLLEAISAIGGR